MIPFRTPFLFAVILALIMAMPPLMALEPVWQSPVREDCLSDLAIAGDGSRVITGSSTGDARVYDRNGTLLWQAEVPGSVMVGCFGNGSGFLVATREVLVTNKGAVRYYDGNGTLAWIVHAGWTTGISSSEKERRLAVGNRVGDVLVLDEDGKRVALFNDFPKMYVVEGPALSENGMILAYALHERNPQVRYVRIDRRSKVTFKGYSVKAGNTVYVDDEPITKIVLSADGAYLATAGGEGSHGLLCLFAGNGSRIWSRDMERILDVRIEGDGSALYAGTEDGKITSFFRNGSPAWTFQAGSAIQSLSLSGEAGLLAGGTRDGELILLNRTGGLAGHFRIEEFPSGSISHIAISRDGSAVAVVSNGKTLHYFSVARLSPEPPGSSHPSGRELQSTPVLFPAIRSYRFPGPLEGRVFLGNPGLWNLSNNLAIAQSR